MSAQLNHRGPDESGIMSDVRAGLAHRRLSIVGLGNGWQPIPSEDGHTVIIGNGEIYNAPALRRQLESRGHRFRSDSDIEVVLHLFEERGTAAFAELNGMFALAIWERACERVTLVRDRLGIKPLLYAIGSQGLVFASELPALKAGLQTEEQDLLDLDRDSLQDFLSMGYVPAPRSMYRGIRRLEPGEWLSYDAEGHLERQFWWSLPDLVESPSSNISRSAASYSEELVSLLKDSVRLRTLGEVEAGAFLSGGLDSSTLVGLLSQAVDSSVPVFTLSMGDPDFDELEDAQRTAQHFGCTHHVDRMDGTSEDELDMLFQHMGEPFADVSLLPTHRISKFASQHVKYLISGDGGDELFAGYAWLLREVKMRKLPAALRSGARMLSPILKYGQQVRRSNVVGKTMRAMGDLASDSATSFLRRRSLCSPALINDLLHPRVRDEQYLDPLRSHAAIWSGSEMNLLLDLDRRFYLSGDILEKVDRASMMHSLEARVPFLDHRIVELAASIPVPTHLGAKGQGKEVLREAIKKLLPPELLQRKKRGFGIPVDRWFREELAAPLRDRLCDPSFRRREWVDSNTVDQLLKEHASGYANHGHLLWGLWSLSVCQLNT